jgi:glyceraldehyde 3-phosphate dehydrogenase
VVAINDPLPASQLAYLLKYDTVMGRLKHEVRVVDGGLMIDERRVAVSHVDALTAREVDGMDVVVNSSGRDNSRDNLERLVSMGARYVIVSKPLARGVCDRTVLMGVNTPGPDDRILSAGSCTAHCYTPILKALHERWPVVRGFMMTVHAYTSGQNVVDGGHGTDPRRGRAAAGNVVPTTTESLVAFEQVMPELAGRIHGMAQRVPVVNGSNVELVLELRGRALADDINEALRDAAQGEFRGIIEYSTDPLVSSDIVGNPHSGVVDGLLTEAHMAETTMARVIAWYDNEWGYSNRLAELIDAVARS